MASNSLTSHNRPNYIVNLETAYGAPSQAGFGSAVFYENLESSASSGSLEKQALEKYEYFLGEKWGRFGKDAWMFKWKQVYERPEKSERNVISELRSIADDNAKISVPMILDNVSNAQDAQKGLSAAFDDSSVSELAVYNIGDGAAMSGLIVAGRRSNGETVCLVFLLD